MRSQPRPPEPLGLARAGLRLELRRALRDERIALAHECAVLGRARDDHLAPDAEGVRDDARVDDWDRGALAAPVADGKAERVARLVYRAWGDLPGQVNRAVGRDPVPQQLRRRAGLRGGAEAG